MKKPYANDLGILNGKEIFERNFPPPNWAVEGLVPEGLTIIAGRPKVGKSLACMDIANAIATGGLALGSRKTVLGKALYFALEDPTRRLKDRIMKMFNSGTENLLIGRQLPPLNHGCEEVIIMLKDEHPELRIVIIDTMQKVLPSAEKDSYEFYYKYLSPIQQLAHELQLAIVLVTHMRKRSAASMFMDNPFDEIIGSVGIQAVADCLILFDRKPADSKGTLRIAGREMVDGEFNLNFDKEKFLWTLQGDKLIDSENVNHLQVVSIIAGSGEGLKHSEILSQAMEKFEMKDGTARSCIKRLKDNGQILNDHGVYSLPR